MSTQILQPLCQVCTQPFRVSGSTPFLLPCLHSVCETCLTSDLYDVMTCLRCEETFERSHNLQRDALVGKIALLYDVKQNAKELLCTNQNDGNPALSWCHDCKTMFCQTCEGYHSNVKLTREHRLTFVSELSPESFLQTAVPLCKIHKNHPHDLYDADCKIQLCPTCLLLSHRNCEVVHVSDFVMNYKHDVLRPKVRSLEERVAKIVSYLEKAESDRLQETRNATLIKETFMDAFKNLKALVEDREQALFNRLNEFVDGRMKEDEEEKTKTEMKIQRFQSALEYCQMHLDDPDNSIFLDVKDTVDCRINSLLSVDIPHHMVQNPSFEFNTDGFQQLCEQITSFGDLGMSTAEMSNKADTDISNNVDTKHIEHEVSVTKDHQSNGLLQAKLESVIDSMEDRLFFIERADDKIFALKLPTLKFDKESLNRKFASITKEGELLNKSDNPSGRRYWRQLQTYRGTTSTKCLSSVGLQYWEVCAEVRFQRRLKGDKLILETGLCMEEALDTHPKVSGLKSSWMVSLCHCPIHSAICLTFWKEASRLQCITLPSKSATNVILGMGLLFDAGQGTLTFLDFLSERILKTIHGVKGTDDLWPVFGVQCSDLVESRLKIVSGNDTELDNGKKILVKDAVCHKF